VKPIMIILGLFSLTAAVIATAQTSAVNQPISIPTPPVRCTPGNQDSSCGGVLLTPTQQPILCSSGPGWQTVTPSQWIGSEYSQPICTYTAPPTCPSNTTQTGAPSWTGSIWLGPVCTSNGSAAVPGPSSAITIKIFTQSISAANLAATITFASGGALSMASSTGNCVLVGTGTCSDAAVFTGNSAESATPADPDQVAASVDQLDWFYYDSNACSQSNECSTAPPTILNNNSVASNVDGSLTVSNVRATIPTNGFNMMLGMCSTANGFQGVITSSMLMAYAPGSTNNVVIPLVSSANTNIQQCLN